MGRTVICKGTSLTPCKEHKCINLQYCILVGLGSRLQFWPRSVHPHPPAESLKSVWLFLKGFCVSFRGGSNDHKNRYLNLELRSYGWECSKLN